MDQQVDCRGAAKRSQIDQPELVAELSAKFCFTDSLRGVAANAGDTDERSITNRVGAIHLLGGECQYRFEQPDFGIVDRELGRVHTDGKTSGAGGNVVPRERTLSPLVELP